VDLGDFTAALFEFFAGDRGLSLSLCAPVGINGNYAGRDKLGHLFHDAVFFIRRNTKQGLTVLVAAQRQCLDLNSRSQASARSMIACRKPSAQSAAISAPQSTSPDWKRRSVSPWPGNSTMASRRGSAEFRATYLCCRPKKPRKSTAEAFQAAQLDEGR
jgi:hypothetical protein